MVGFNEKDAKRVAKATRIVEKLTKNDSGNKRRPNNSFGGFWAKITDSDDTKYSWEQLLPTDEDKLEHDPDELLTGDCEAETGYAIEASESSSVPTGSHVYLFPGISQDYYVFKYAEGEPLVYFQLAEELTTATGGHCEARILKLNHPNSNTFLIDTSKDAIEVYDWYRRNSDYPEVDSPGMWFGKVGYRGLAQKRVGSNGFLDENGTGGTHDDVTRVKYDIVWMEQIAERIMFTIPEGNRPYSSGGGTVIDVDVIRTDGQGIHPTATFESSGDELPIHVPFFFNDICQYCYGFAEYDYTEGKYYIVECTRIANFAYGRITENMCGSSSTIPIDNFQIIPQGIHVANPEIAPTTASNRFAHAGPDNYEVLLMRTTLAAVSGSAPQPWTWVIVDIGKREKEFVTDVSVTDGAIKKKTLTVRTEYCDPVTPPAWQTIIEIGNCDGTED